jgi:phosphohistidine phosphatase
VQVVLVHHGEAAPATVDPRQPLTPEGRSRAERHAQAAAARGVRPEVVWHSGKLRARQTAEIFWRACNALAELSATRDIQPGDPAQWMHDRLRGESRDILIVGHFPHLPRLLGALTRAGGDAPFPPHGVVALDSSDAGELWRESWRLS